MKSETAVLERLSRIADLVAARSEEHALLEEVARFARSESPVLIKPTHWRSGS